MISANSFPTFFGKTRLKQALAFAFASTFWAASQATASCPIEISSPENTATISVASPPWLGGDFSEADNPAYDTIVLSGSTAPAVPDGTYNVWCIFADGNLGAITYPATTLWATCDPNLDTELAGLYNPGVFDSSSVDQSQAAWQQVNYILNHQAGFYFMDVQMAIWNLVGGPPPANPPAPSNPAAVSALLAAASANAASWEPQCGDVVGVVVAVSGDPNEQDQLLIIQVPYVCPQCPCEAHDIKYNFNGTQIIFQSTPGGSYVWFLSDGKVTGVPATGKALLHISDQTITIPAKGSSPQYVVPVPDAYITFDSSVTVATTMFDTVNNVWRMTFPTSKLSGNILYAAAAFKVPSIGLPGGIQNVDWNGTFTTDTEGLSLSWQWHAAAYSDFTSDYNSIAPKPTDDNSASMYKNSDQAGTPEGTDPVYGKPWKKYVVGGASGGGGANYTGSGSSTISITPCVCPNP